MNKQVINETYGIDLFKTTNGLVTKPMNATEMALAAAEKIRIVAEHAENVFIERSEAIRALALGLACGEHVCFLAAPGTAKTAMGEFFGNAFGARFFYTALGIESTADELFGPTDPMTLKDAVWSRKLAGLSTCTIAFVDEVGKGSQEIQNLMLGAMEERKLPAGDLRINLPLHMLFAATNETLDENPAFWDRFTIRAKIGYIKQAENFARMLTSDVTHAPSTPITQDEFTNLREVTSAMALTPSPEALHAMVELWNTYPTKIKDRPLSDRRWKRVLKVAAGSALLRGSDVIHPVDLSVAQFMLWSDAEDNAHVAEVKKWVSALTDKEINLFAEQSLMLQECEKEYKDLPPTASTQEKSKIHYKVERLLFTIKKQKGAQWVGLADRCETLKAKLVSFEIDF